MAKVVWILTQVFVQLSGIVAILFCGITMSHYMYPNLSHSTKEFSRHVVEVASFIMETLIFSYLVSFQKGKEN